VDVNRPTCETDFVTGDGIGDWIDREAPDGDVVVRAGPLATETSPETVRVHYLGDPGDPAYESCYGGYFFFDWPEGGESVTRVDVLAAPGEEIVFARDYWWEEGFTCPLAEPLLLSGAPAAGTIEVGPETTGSLVPIAAVPVPLSDVDGDGTADFEADHQAFRGPAVVVDGAVDLTAPLGEAAYATAVPDVDGDGRADFYAEESDALVFFAGDGTGGIGAPILRIAADGVRYSWLYLEYRMVVVGFGDATAILRLDDVAAALR
jgi:hypothetical protein